MTHTTKLLSLFLLAGVFAVSTLQPATAQTASHDVTVDVDAIDELTVNGAPSITITSGDLNTWIEGDATSGFDVTSNSQTDRKIEVSSASKGGGGAAMANLGLKVTADGTPAFGTEAGPVVITSVGSSTLSGGDLLTGFQGVDSDGNGLLYKAKANANYDPSITTKITVDWTLTAN